MDSVAPLVDPGRANINVSPFTPATLRDSIEYGVRSWPKLLAASAMPGISRSSNGEIASGVTSLGDRPVPPVRMIRSVFSWYSFSTLAYEEMAEKKIHEIRETAFEKFDLTCMHIYHSLGTVKVGEICFFVFVSSPHREASYQASHYIVEEIKSNAPIYGKELFEDDSHQWKVNQ